MPGTTAFPTALDEFPEIGPNTPENAPGKEHDVVHQNVHAAVLALQAKVGVDDSEDEGTIDARVAALEEDAETLAIAVGACVQTAAVGALSGVAPLDSSGLVPSEYLPSYVDDVLEFADEASLPATGESGKLYVTLDTGGVFRWSGSMYVDVGGGASSTDGVPEGSSNLYFTATRVLSTELTGLDTYVENINIAESDTVLGALGKLQYQLNMKVGVDSPAFEGTPTAPTAPPFNGTALLANCTYVDTAVYDARTPRVQSVTSASTVTPSMLNDFVRITALAVNVTLANPTNIVPPVNPQTEDNDGFVLTIRIRDNGSARTISYGSKYRAIGVSLPTTTVPGKLLYLRMVYNLEDDKWDVVSVSQEA